MALECVLELQRTLLPFPDHFKLECRNGFGQISEIVIIFISPQVILMCSQD